MKGGPVVGDRLKLARTAAGLSLRGLEERMNGLVTAQAIGKYERNEMMPSSTVLISLARALGVSEDYLLNAGEVELVAVEFRKKKLTKAKEDAQVRARVLSEVERYLEIERILAIDSKQPPAPRVTVRNLDDVEEAAEELRKRWRLGEDAIPNLCEFLEDKGIKICAIPLPSSVSGVQAVVTAAKGHNIPVIVINSEHSVDRQRFTLAHELGHLCLEVKGQLDLEEACQRFAGAFLVPAKILRREVGAHRSALPPRELFGLKLLFGMSAQAIVYRCRQLGIISQPTLSGLFKLFAARGWRLNEPGDLNAERPARFERLCIRALAEGCISEAKASELLRKTVKEVVASMDEPPPELSDARPAGV
jgi:Zn-dependent peptidase ImmA (M78 family)